MIHLLRLAAGEPGRSPAFVKHIHDHHVVRYLLPVGHRSAVFKLGIPQNRPFERSGAPVCSFYIRSSADEVLRVEIPYWVAQDAHAVGTLHASILADSQGLAYPASLTCAHHRVAITSGLAEELQHKALAMYIRRGGSPSLASAKHRSKGYS